MFIDFLDERCKVDLTRTFIQIVRAGKEQTVSPTRLIGFVMFMESGDPVRLMGFPSTWTDCLSSPTMWQ
jgi:hypothetical protein